MPRHDHFMLLFAPSPSWSQGVTTAEGQGQAVETGVPPCPSALAFGGRRVLWTGAYPEALSPWQTSCISHALDGSSCERSLKPCFI